MRHHLSQGNFGLSRYGQFKNRQSLNKRRREGFNGILSANKNCTLNQNVLSQVLFLRPCMCVCFYVCVLHMLLHVGEFNLHAM